MWGDQDMWRESEDYSHYMGEGPDDEPEPPEDDDADEDQDE
jgi:hypothetical protein